MLFTFQSGIHFRRSLTWQRDSFDAEMPPESPLAQLTPHCYHGIVFESNPTMEFSVPSVLSGMQKLKYDVRPRPRQ